MYRFSLVLCLEVVKNGWNNCVVMFLGMLGL